MKNFAILIFAAILLLPIGCRSFEPPAGYVALDDAPWPYDDQAVSPEDCRFTVRDIENEGGGTLGFWVKSVQNQLERNRGYLLRSAGDITTESGLRGKELRFDTSSKGVKYLYLVWIFPYETGFLPVKKRLIVAEAGGEANVLEPELDALSAAARKLD